MAKAKAPRENLTVAWCDGGMVDAKFTEGLVYTVINGPAAGLPIVNAIRVTGNQIGRQRQNLIDMWYDANASDWILWVDSDVVINATMIKQLWNQKDAVERPLVSGVYMVTRMNEQSFMQPLPDVFKDTDNNHVLEFVHPLPATQFMADSAGFGLLLMHRSVVTKLRERWTVFFYENMTSEETFVGEDIVFFRKCKELGIPLWIDGSVIAPHMKRFSFDENYYKAWWLINAMQQDYREGQE